MAKYQIEVTPGLPPQILGLVLVLLRDNSLRQARWANLGTPTPSLEGASWTGNTCVFDLESVVGWANLQIAA